MKKIIALAMIAVFAIASEQVSLKTCVGCHGKTFEKKALSRSKIVSDMNASEIIAALNGYGNGTYGGMMKGVMVAQMKSVSDINGTAKAIKELK